jgi:pilus assembly protein CpaC
MSVQKVNTKASLKAIAAAMISLALAPAPMLMNARLAQASDMDVAQTPENDAHFVRIGINKSVVIKLPAEAKDVIVGNPAIVDAVVRTKTTAYLFARTYGQTNIFFFDKDGQQILAVDLEVTGDITGLRKLLDRSLPGNRIKVDTINNKIVLSGVAATKAEAERALVLAGAFTSVGAQMADNSFGHASDGAGIINAMTIAGEDQVMLKVRVVEIQRDVLKQFGVNLQALLSAGKFAFNITSAPVAAATSGIKSIYTGSGGDTITGVLKAMESDGLLKTLAEPNLTAISGQAAEFDAGGEIPIQRCSNTVPSTCTYEYKQYGVHLGFTPMVQDKGRITLKINTNVSEIGASQNGIPTFTKRSTDTTVELPSGGSMMLAGLIKDTTRQNVDGLPGLRKLPVLGTLFRSREYTANQTELVVIVTPYLVGASTERQLATPVDNLNEPTEKQAIFFGRLNKVYGAPGKKPDGVYHGNVGFIVE